MAGILEFKNKKFIFLDFSIKKKKVTKTLKNLKYSQVVTATASVSPLDRQQ